VTPKPGPWPCLRCGTVLGRVTTAGDLIVTARPLMLDVMRTAAIHCPACGETRTFTGRAIRIDVPPSQTAA
jgi:DNA-directed RNA polymerase subunit RPC12/RpoP